MRATKEYEEVTLENLPEVFGMDTDKKVEELIRQSSRAANTEEAGRILFESYNSYGFPFTLKEIFIAHLCYDNLKDTKLKNAKLNLETFARNYFPEWPFRDLWDSTFDYGFSNAWQEDVADRIHLRPYIRTEFNRRRALMPKP